MALTTTNWTLNSYTPATWTDLINDATKSTVATLIMSNTGVGAAVVQVRLTDDTPTSLATILPGLSVSASDSQVLDLRSINVSGTQRIQVQVDVAGVEFLASGVSE